MNTLNISGTFLNQWSLKCSGHVWISFEIRRNKFKMRNTQRNKEATQRRNKETQKERNKETKKQRSNANKETKANTETKKHMYWSGGASLV